MNWFKHLFIRKDSQAESLPLIPERKPNISEPVISFVETFKANPKRFKIVEISSSGQYPTILGPTIISHKLIDKHEKLSWNFTSTTNYCFSDSRSYSRKYDGPYFLTDDETSYIVEVLSPYFNSRVDVYLEALSKREREALKNVYCK